MRMRQKTADPDRLELKNKKGMWRRYAKLFLRCRLPWLLLAIYLALDLGLVNVGVNETDYTAQLFAGDTSPGLLIQLITVIVINLVGTSLLVFMRIVTSGRMDQNMRNVLIEKIMRLPMSYFKRENPRDAVYRIVSSATVIDNSVMYVIIPMVTAGYTAFAVIRRVFSHDWRLSAMMLVFLPLQIVIAIIFGRINFSLGVRDADVNAGLMERLAEMVTNIPLAKAFARERREAEKGEELTARLYRISIKSSWLGQLKDLSTAVLDMAQAAAMTLVGMFLLQGGDINIRAWISFFMFSSTFNSAVYELLMYWNNVKSIQGSADRVAEIMDAQEEYFGGEPCEELSGDLELKNVHFAYEEDQTVLTDVSCVFPDDQVTALLGVSGCGKTTLVNLLTRLYDPQSGSITVNGKDIHDYALDGYRSQFVMVSQNGMLFSGTVRENVGYGNGGVSDAEVAEALKKAGAYDFVMAMPGGLDARLEEYGNNLSGGQRQRLTVARALLSKAHYIILDEPASSMDAIAAAELMKALGEAAKGRCMIVIAHTPAVLSLADRVVVVEDGAVTAQGGAAEAAERSAFLRAFTGKEGSAV